jgi:hypothetical protein
MHESLQCLTPDNYFTPGDKGYTFMGLAPGSGKLLWTTKHRLRALAMVATDGALFAAGVPDIVDPSDPLGALEGREGGLLLALDARSGEGLSQLKLAAPPVFDGMAAANGRLYLSTTDGKLLCLGAPR